MRVGCGQIAWQGVPEAVALAEIRDTGYEGAAPRFRPGRAPAEAASLLAACGLAAAPPYFSAPLWRSEGQEAMVAGAAEAAAFARSLGCTELYVAAGGDRRAAGRTRRQAAGHVAPEDALTDEEFRRLAGALTRVGEAALARGVRACFHPHVGTVVETEAEVERLLELTDPEVVFLGPDTGHLAWAGVDPVAFCARHRDRIRTVHLKDIDERVRRRGVEEGWTYDTFARRGIFAELGAGSLDFPAILAALREGFEGWLVVETDVPRAPSPRESAALSRAYLRGLGL